MARPPLRPIQGTAQLNPVASPVDAYVAPGKNRLLEFAESLQKVSAPLQTFLGERAEKASKEDAIRGEAAFYADNAEGMAEGVRSGQIPPQYSPAFVRGWKLAQGNVAGGNLREQFAAAYDAWEGKNSEDPVAFDTFYQEFLRTHISSTSDPDVLRGLLPSIKEIEANGRARHIEYRSKVTYDGSLDAGVAGVSQDVDAANDAGLVSEKGTDYDTLFANVFKRRDEWVKTGGRAEDFDTKMLTAMSLKIVETRDPGLLKWFDQKVPGKDYTYGDTPEGQKVKQATIENLEVIARRSEVEDSQKQTKADKLAADNTVRQTMDILSANPGAALPDGLVREAEKYDPAFKSRVAGWREDLNKGFTDNDALKKVYDDVIAGGGMKAVTDAWGQGVFGRIEDLNAARSFAENWEGNRSKIEDGLSSNIAKDFLSTIEQRTKGLNDISGMPLPGLSNEGFEAQYDFKRMVTDWIVRNPDKAQNLTEREKAISEIGRLILDRIPEGDGFEAAPYNRPEGQDFDNPFTPEEQGDGTGEPSTEGSDPVSDDEVRTFLGEMTPEQRTQVEQAAAATGKTSQDFVREQLTANEALRPIVYNPDDPDLGEGDVREGGISLEQATAFLDEAFSESGSTTSEGQLSDLKSLILKHEAGGNWNAVYGNSRSTADLGKYTLDQILARQQAARRRGVASTAIGGPQFIYKTLRGLKRDLGLIGTEKFTPELQSRLMDELLRQRGLQQFLDGRISKRQFALNLSQEWASLPNPNTGRSYYAGDGLNASRIPVRDVYAALGFGVGSSASTEAEPRTGPTFRESMGVKLRPGHKSMKQRSNKRTTQQRDDRD